MAAFDPNEMIARFRDRAAAVRKRPLPPVAGEDDLAALGAPAAPAERRAESQPAGRRLSRMEEEIEAARRAGMHWIDVRSFHRPDRLTAAQPTRQPARPPA